MTPTVIAALRCALRDLWHYDGCGCNTCVPVAEAIARVEQDLAAKDAEIAELRKRPTLDEIREHCVDGREWKDVRVAFEDAYAAKARAEAPK